MLDASGIIIEEDYKVMQDTYALLNVLSNEGIFRSDNDS